MRRIAKNRLLPARGLTEVNESWAVPPMTSGILRGEPFRESKDRPNPSAFELPREGAAGQAAADQGENRKMKLLLRIKFRDGDFWTPLLLGDVSSEKLDIRATRVAQLIDNVADDPEADAAEMSLSRYNLRVDQGEAQGIVAVPFFIMRGFRTRNIVTTLESPLERLEELEDKTIGLSGWQDSGNTWTRALLRRAGVNCDRIRWVLSRCTAENAVEHNRSRQFGPRRRVLLEPGAAHVLRRPERRPHGARRRGKEQRLRPDRPGRGRRQGQPPRPRAA